MQQNFLEKRLKQLEEEKLSQDKYIKKQKMLDVLKFFKRTSDSPVISKKEFEALQQGLAVFGIT